MVNKYPCSYILINLLYSKYPYKVSLYYVFLYPSFQKFHSPNIRKFGVAAKKQHRDPFEVEGLNPSQGAGNISVATAWQVQSVGNDLLHRPTIIIIEMQK